MKHKTWFRLMLKAIGILLIGLSIPRVTEIMIVVVNDALSGLTPLVPGPIGWNLFAVSGPLIQFFFGVYLLFGGKWIANLAIPSNRPYCPECGYDLSENSGDTCPECGRKGVRG